MFTKQDAEKFAADKLKEFNLDQAGWTFVWDTARARLGYCTYTNKTVGLSSFVFDAIKDELKESEAKDTILHELGHALVGSGVGHGRKWADVTLSIGGSAQRTYTDVKILDVGKYAAAAKYTATCCHCGKTTAYHRMSKHLLQRACGVCCRRYNGGRWAEGFVMEVTQNY